MSEVKYRHPANHDLAWSGKGRQPKWVEAYIANGGSLVSLDIEVQNRSDSRLNDADIDTNEAHIDLGIGDVMQGVSQRVVIDTQDERLDIAASEPPEAGQQQLEVCLREFGFQALTVEEFIQVGIEELNQATIRACRAGVAFWAAQEAVRNTECAGRTPEFKDWIAESGLTKERVYECIRIAKFYARLPPENRAKALTIGKKHALLLASLPQEVIDQAAESGNDLIEKADMMTVAELREEIRLMQRREKNYEAELERCGNQIKRLSETKTRLTDFLQRTEDVREESMALQLGAELNLNGLKKLFEETDELAPEGKLQFEQLWVTAHTVAARALDLLEFMRARAPEDMPDRPMTQHMLTPVEAVRWLNDYPLIENRFAAEQSVREQRRADTRPRGPGRPKGSSNKSSEA